MQDRITAGIAQWLAEPARGEENLARALGHIRELAAGGAELIVLPEMWPCGYRIASLPEDVRATAEPLYGPRGEALSAVAAETGTWLVAGSVPERDGDAIYNTAVVYSPTGELVAAHRKAYLWTGAGEGRVFTAGDSLTSFDAEPFGRVGVVVCFDGDFPETARAFGAAGVRLVILPSAYDVDAVESWDRLYPANAIANGQWWIMVNQCGSYGDGQAALLGASRILSPVGETVAEARRAANGETPEPELLIAEIPFAAALADWDARFSVLLSTGIRDLHVADASATQAGRR
ncbi:MAG TPA: carbon-nitrogen hydrolase family protein [Microbacteriaceae bacterium]|nr:carbon-nitrogen hydrolase family protein [Microbacteriaceae bacterium]